MQTIPRNRPRPSLSPVEKDSYWSKVCRARGHYQQIVKKPGAVITEHRDCINDLIAEAVYSTAYRTLTYYA